ncbi:MAG: hypothetical protein U5K53_01450 [Halanaerobiales bacterium]|nr:hypothetical protein [Halanaerobiales bacterium]
MFSNKNKEKKIYYSGIGSRNTPKDILDIMEKMGFQLGKRNYVLRSGASPGADSAFERGALKSNADCEIYLPWKNFQNKEGKNYINAEMMNNYNKAKEIARNHHYNFEELSDNSQKLIIRDTYQVLGKNLDRPSEFVICWTPDGCITDRDRSIKTGGTGQAISIASKLKIPIFNLKLKEHKKRIEEWLAKL